MPARPMPILDVAATIRVSSLGRSIVLVSEPGIAVTDYLLFEMKGRGWCLEDIG